MHTSFLHLVSRREWMRTAGGYKNNPPMLPFVIEYFNILLTLHFSLWKTHSIHMHGRSVNCMELWSIHKWKGYAKIKRTLFSTKIHSKTKENTILLLALCVQSRIFFVHSLFPAKTARFPIIMKLFAELKRKRKTKLNRMSVCLLLLLLLMDWSAVQKCLHLNVIV